MSEPDAMRAEITQAGMYWLATLNGRRVPGRFRSVEEAREAITREMLARYQLVPSQ